MSDRVRIKAKFQTRDGSVLNYCSPHTYEGSVEDFGEPTIEGPSAGITGARFIIKVPRKARSTEPPDIEESVTFPGEKVEDFEPMSQGPVIVVQDPPKLVVTILPFTSKKAA